MLKFTLFDLVAHAMAKINFRRRIRIPLVFAVSHVLLYVAWTHSAAFNTRPELKTPSHAWG
jgi:hypothetical protein